MAPFIGTSQVTMTENADAASSAIGGGNLSVLLNSSGTSQVTIVYTYIPTNALKPGNYTVIQTVQPPGFTDGKESAQGVVIPHQPNIDIIPVAFDAVNNSVHNDFGKLQPASISGNVYFDANNNGIKDPGETGIQGTTVTLSGTNDQGPVSQTATTDANGFYQFTNLLPGTYTVQETQPATWLDGKDTAGTLGGTVTNDQINNIVVPSVTGSLNNNFGELKPPACRAMCTSTPTTTASKMPAKRAFRARRSRCRARPTRGLSPRPRPRMPTASTSSRICCQAAIRCRRPSRRIGSTARTLPAPWAAR